MGKQKLVPRRSKRKRAEEESTALESTTVVEMNVVEGNGLHTNDVEMNSIETNAVVVYQEEEQFALSGDDCDVVGDEDLDEIGYEAADEEDANQKDGEEEFREEEDGDRDRVGVEEEQCEDFEAQFGEAARDEKDVTDTESGDDIWEEEKLPDPVSHSEDEASDVEVDEHAHPENPEELLKLGKTFSSPNEFKNAVLRNQEMCCLDKDKLGKEDHRHKHGKEDHRDKHGRELDLHKELEFPKEFHRDKSLKDHKGKVHKGKDHKDNPLKYKGNKDKD